MPLALLATGGPAQSEARLEIRAAPADYVFLNESGRRTGHRDVMLQNVAVVNTGSVEVTLEVLEIGAERRGHAVMTNAIEFDLYEPNWERQRAYYETPGVQERQDSIYLFSELLRGGVALSPSRQLAPASAIVVSKHPMTFVGWQTPDALRLRVRGRTAEGEPVEATLELRVGRPAVQNSYHFPLRGRWYVNSSSSLNSHHRMRPAHEFALDLIRTGADGRSHRGDGTSPDDYHAYGEPVHAVAAGTVVRAIGDVPDTELPRLGESRTAFAARVLSPMWDEDPSGRIASGNLLVIEHDGGEHSAYVHLKPGSLRVQVGDTVTRGQVIAEVGFSGDAFQPHLHFQVNRGPDPQYSRSLPVYFENVRPVSFASTNDAEPRRLFMAGEFVETVGGPPSDREAPGNRGGPLVRLRGNLQAELDRLRERHGFPGATAAVAMRDGQWVSVATGFADLEAEVPMRPDHRMLIGSIGKTFVAALAVKLQLAGQLDLDDRIAEWFGDEAWLARLPNHEHITLRMLLNHSSGIQNHAWFPQLVSAVERTFDPDIDYAPSHRELVAMVLDRDPLFPAGNGFEYTDTGYILAGWILEQATGQDYYDLLASEILEPLELRETVPANTREIERVAAGYVGDSAADNFPGKVAEVGRIYYDPTFEWTGGGLASTSVDLARWGQRLYGGSAFAGDYLPELLDSTADRPPILDIPSIGPYRYGLGVYLADSPLGPLIGHGGVMYGYTSRMRYFVEHGFAVAVQVNRFRFGDDLQAYLLALARAIVD